VEFSLLPLFEDDLAEGAVLEPHSFHPDVPQLSPRGLLCFFHDVLDDLFARGELSVVYELRSEIGRNLVYSYETTHGPITVVHPGVGAPLAAGFTEELIACGLKSFVAVGGAGALRDELGLGHIMVVDSALRDEGTSFHYLAPSRIVEAHPPGVQLLQEVLAKADVSFFTGRTWTTDGLFREARSRVTRRVDEGCSMVDMEASAFMAVSRYRRVPFAQILYAGDSLAGAEWDGRGWDRASDIREHLFRLAAEAAAQMSIEALEA